MNEEVFGTGFSKWHLYCLALQCWWPKVIKLYFEVNMLAVRIWRLYVYKCMIGLFTTDCTLSLQLFPNSVTCHRMTDQIYCPTFSFNKYVIYLLATGRSIFLDCPQLPFLCK